MPDSGAELLENAAAHGVLVCVGIDGQAEGQGRADECGLWGIVDSKALVFDKNNRFEAWRSTHAEYQPHKARMLVSMFEAVVQDHPKPGSEFSTWYHRWLEMIRGAETLRGKFIDDGIKCMVGMRRSPMELRD